jgi:exodeoxyribonuclease V alpha subunit
LILVSLVALQEGSTRFPVTGPLSQTPMRRVLITLCGDGFGPGAIDTIATAIDVLLQSNRAPAVVGQQEDEYKPLLYIAPYIMHQSTYCCERELAIRLAALLTTRPEEQVEADQLARALRDVIARPVIVQGKQIAMSEEQCSSVVTASARAGLTVISGGPGTGKTSIVVAIMRLMVRLGVDPSEIALTAPTGKAAYRMGECVNESLTRIEGRDNIDQALLDARVAPATIHRLLAYSPESGRFRHHRNNPLSAKVVIVDEGSMLDVTLMERLTNAIQPGARLILLGDANQLPSVAAGSVFRALVPSPEDQIGPLAAASMRLEVNHRMKSEDAAGRSILLAARSINDGGDLMSPADEAIPPIVARRSSPKELAFAGVEFLAAAPRELGSFLDRWYAGRVRGGNEIAELVAHEYVERDGHFDDADCERLRLLFAHVGKSRILCVTRVFETGADRLNARLHSRAAESAGVAADRTPFVVGEPLIVLRNDYERGLFNGDNGIRLWVRRGADAQIPMAIFPRGDNFVAFRFEALRDSVELSYAMTVHKAQGSEFDSIAIVLPEKPIAVLTRELIYTAVSRSRTSVVIVGDESTFKQAVATRVERFSGLADRLKLELAG